MLGNYFRIGYGFNNRLNIFAVMKVKFNLRQTSDENKDTLIYLVCTINHKQERWNIKPSLSFSFSLAGRYFIASSDNGR